MIWVSCRSEGDRGERRQAGLRWWLSLPPQFPTGVQPGCSTSQQLPWIFVF
uniref:Uncharacterized protein n=1 Tax=Rhizophora mucronata TaxID=61149 RepID=A0A2P2P5D4_RHIMU